MYKYRINIKKVSGRLNESVLPSKSLIVKSKTKKSDKEIFAEASKYFKKKYGLVIESADIQKDIKQGTIKKEVFTIEDLMKLCKKRFSDEFYYEGSRVTPDGRKYELAISGLGHTSLITNSDTILVWAASPMRNNTKPFAEYHLAEKAWIEKKPNKFVRIVGPSLFK